jgi:glycosyltransferase involved in cell wall biosynthesis
MDKKKQLSFVMPVYNGCAYLAETLNSLLAQTLKDIEIIVIDDGSVDSIEPLKRYYTAKDSRIVWNTLEKNAGQGNARNVGNSLATSPIIAVNDADDLSYPERAKEIVAYFKKHPKSDIVHSGFAVMDAMGDVKTVVKVQTFDTKRVMETTFCFICHSTMAYRKNVSEDIKYDTDKIDKMALDDWKFEVDATKKGYKIDSIDKELVIYRDLKTSISSRRNEQEALELKREYLKTLGGL